MTGSGIAMTSLDEAELRRCVERLAPIPRPSASAGEGRAAAMIAEELRELGAEVTLMEEPVNGTYWQPLGLLALLAVASALVPRRSAALLAALAAWAAADDLELGSRRLRRAVGTRACHNVLARLGPPDSDQAVLIHVHHDASHSGRVFDTRLAKAGTRAFGPLIDRLRTTPPLLWTSVAGPALVALGQLARSRALRVAGGATALVNGAILIDIGRAPVVPGANDNLSGVAAGIAAMRELAAQPPQRTSVFLFSSGSEESFLEGFDAFRRRGFPGLPREHTTCLCLESVGSPRLLLLDGEGLLRLHRYPEAVRRQVEECARELGIELDAPFRFRFATGGQVSLRAGIPTAVISSLDWYNAPRNYHWPTDTPEALDYRSVRNAAALAEATVRRIDAAAQ
ncbi:MAG TPA: M28 family peptidase [Thermoleophilaceae bacterium]|nr:M28 family peptidase [Thermoleophilaceae bacterium]